VIHCSNLSILGPTKEEKLEKKVKEKLELSKMTRQELLKKARELGVKNAARQTKTELQDSIGKQIETSA
jgi:hypothetical protein